ncbi:MAG: PEP-CTERM sorting domain-containing protein [Pirellulales bacterium]|nr:PEP-CTERM sorting domain-containing protein [Pirellulales bacterium]
MRRTILAVVILAAALVNGSVHAATIQFLTPAGSSLGVAYGVDGLNVVGQDVAQRGFLYNGATKTYTVIQPPGGGATAARGVSGNTIVGYYIGGGGTHGYLFDGVNYTSFDHPLGINSTSPWGIDGNNVVGQYVDASKIVHGFIFDGANYTTLDFPGAKATRALDISGNLVVGSYEDSKNRTHGFVYDGATWTTLDDPQFMGTTTAYGIDGSKIVGTADNNSTFFGAFIYNGVSYSHPFGIEGGAGQIHQFFGISGNRIVGTYNDRPFVYVIPEPSTFVLAALGLLALLPLARRKRSAASPPPG